MAVKDHIWVRVAAKENPCTRETQILLLVHKTWWSLTKDTTEQKDEKEERKMRLLWHLCYHDSICKESSYKPLQHLSEFTPQIIEYLPLHDVLKALKSLYTNSFPSLQYIILKDCWFSYTNAFGTMV